MARLRKDKPRLSWNACIRAAVAIDHTNVAHFERAIACLAKFSECPFSDAEYISQQPNGLVFESCCRLREMSSVIAGLFPVIFTKCRVWSTAIVSHVRAGYVQTAFVLRDADGATHIDRCLTDEIVVLWVGNGLRKRSRDTANEEAREFGIVLPRTLKSIK